MWVKWRGNLVRLLNLTSSQSPISFLSYVQLPTMGGKYCQLPRSLSIIRDRNKLMCKMTTPSSQRKLIIIRAFLLCQKKKCLCKSCLTWWIPHCISLNFAEPGPSLAQKFTSEFPASALARLKICSWFLPAAQCVGLLFHSAFNYFFTFPGKGDFLCMRLDKSLPSRTQWKLLASCSTKLSPLCRTGTGTHGLTNLAGTSDTVLYAGCRKAYTLSSGTV